MTTSIPKGKRLELKFAQQATEDYAELCPLPTAEHSDLNLMFGTDILFKVGKSLLAAGITLTDNLSKIIKDVEKASKNFNWYVEIVIQGQNWGASIDQALGAINNEIRELMKTEPAGFYVIYANPQGFTIECFNSRSPRTKGY